MHITLPNSSVTAKHQRERIPSSARSRLTGMRDDRGSVMIETATSFMLLIAMIIGIIEFSMMIYTYSVMAEAVRRGVRYASVHGADSSVCSGPSAGCADPAADNVKSEVNNFAKSFVPSLSGATVQVLYPDAGGCKPSSLFTVSVTYIYQPLFNLPGFNFSFHPSAQGRILY